MVNVFRVLKNKTPQTRARLLEQMAGREAQRKRAERKAHRNNQTRQRRVALGAAPFVYVSKNYVNPISLGPPPLGVIVYRLKNRQTKRTDFYNVGTIHKLAGKNNYGILVADPKKGLFRNPVTRGTVYPRNLQRVRLRQSEARIARVMRARKSH